MMLDKPFIQDALSGATGVSVVVAAKIGPFA